MLKLWVDVVDDHRVTKPLDPADVLAPERKRDFRTDSRGILTRPIDVAGWERAVRLRRAFLDDLDDDEHR